MKGSILMKALTLILSRRAILKIYLQERLSLIRTIEKTTKNPQIAEELCQEVYIKADSSIRNGASIRNFRNWLNTIAHHISLDYLRNENPSRFVERNPDEFLISKEKRPDQIYQSKEWRSRLREALKTLTPLQRKVLTLRWGMGLSFSEISELMGLNREAVRSLAKRGIQELRLRSSLSGLLPSLNA